VARYNGSPRKNLERRPAGLPDKLTTKLDLVIKLKKAKLRVVPAKAGPRLPLLRSLK
jgi:hypothetical protein